MRRRGICSIVVGAAILCGGAGQAIAGRTRVTPEIRAEKAARAVPSPRHGPRAVPRPAPDRIAVPGVFSPVWHGAYRSRPGQLPWSPGQGGAGPRRT